MSPRSANADLVAEVRVLSERVQNLLDRMEEDRAKHASLEDRVGKLERSRAYLHGAAAFGGAVIAWLGHILASLASGGHG